MTASKGMVKLVEKVSYHIRVNIFGNALLYIYIYIYINVCVCV